VFVTEAAGWNEEVVRYAHPVIEYQYSQSLRWHYFE